LLCDDTAVASNSREVAKSAEISTVVSPDDEPSAEWGWHGGFPKGTVIGGVITIILLIAFIPGPYQSRTQDIWLVLIALGIVAGIIGHVIRKRNAWRK
jgi:VIT1/CCC1 family predicted Fe2+/Mn2+ transporter